MKRIALALIATTGLAVASARADHVNFGVSIGTPGYYAAPGYAPAYAPGYWRDQVVNVWIPPHWESRVDQFGLTTNFYEPGHYEARTQRVWVNTYGDRDRWEHERWERMERERREHERHEWMEHHDYDRR